MLLSNYHSNSKALAVQKHPCSLHIDLSGAKADLQLLANHHFTSRPPDQTRICQQMVVTTIRTYWRNCVEKTVWELGRRTDHIATVLVSLVFSRKKTNITVGGGATRRQVALWTGNEETHQHRGTGHNVSCHSLGLPQWPASQMW